MEGQIIQIGKDKYKVIREYFSETYNKQYILLEDRKNHELFVCSLDDQGYVHEVEDASEMKMLDIVFNENEE